jgi:catechol 2,3-dioxygenase-like lactoylglutathione lyase family enzyme
MRIDHVALPARDPEASAWFLTHILGVAPPRPEGPDGDMFSVPLDGADVLFVAADAVEAHHMAFNTSEAEFIAVVERLRARGLPFGNDPEQPRNGRVDDPLGGAGRVYFSDPDGHLFEVTAAARHP